MSSTGGAGYAPGRTVAARSAGSAGPRLRGCDHFRWRSALWRRGGAGTTRCVAGRHACILSLGAAVAVPPAPDLLAAIDLAGMGAQWHIAPDRATALDEMAEVA